MCAATDELIQTRYRCGRISKISLLAYEMSVFKTGTWYKGSCMRAVARSDGNGLPRDVLLLPSETLRQCLTMSQQTPRPTGLSNPAASVPLVLHSYTAPLFGVSL